MHTQAELSVKRSRLTRSGSSVPGAGSGVASGGVYLGLAHTGSHAASVLTMVALPEPGVYLAMTSARAAVRVAAMMAHPIAASTVISGHRTAACRWTGGAVPEISLLVTAGASKLTLRRPVLPLHQC